MVNRWKKAFLILLGLNVIFILIVAGLYFSLFISHSPNLNENVPPGSPIGEAPVFTVSGNRDQLTTLLNEELQKTLKGNLEASISLKKNVMFLGNLKILGAKIPYKMTFEPQVEQNGEEVVLNETSMTLGSIPLPVGEVLQFIKAGSNFPKWVIVDPDKKRLVVHLANFVIRDEFTIRAKQIDLPHNKLIFNIYKTTQTTKR